MVSSGDVFINASDILNSPKLYLPIHNESRLIEYDILLAAEAGLLNTVVTGTPMTDIILPVVHAITSINLSTSTFTLANHGFKQNSQVQFSTSGNLPAPLTAGTVYYVILVDANNFQVAASQHDVVYNNKVVLTSAPQTVAIGSVANPLFTVASVIIIDGVSVNLTGTSLAQTIIDINTAAVPNIIASQSNHNLVLTNTIGVVITTSGAAATTAGMPSSTPASVVSVQGISLAEQAYDVFIGQSTDPALTYQILQIKTHFTNLGYTIQQQQNPTVPQVFQWVLNWS